MKRILYCTINNSVSKEKADVVPEEKPAPENYVNLVHRDNLYANRQVWTVEDLGEGRIGLKGERYLKLDSVTSPANNYANHFHTVSKTPVAVEITKAENGRGYRIRHNGYASLLREVWIKQDKSLQEDLFPFREKAKCLNCIRK